MGQTPLPCSLPDPSHLFHFFSFGVHVIFCIITYCIGAPSQNIWKMREWEVEGLGWDHPLPPKHNHCGLFGYIYYPFAKQTFLCNFLKDQNSAGSV